MNYSPIFSLCTYHKRNIKEINENSYRPLSAYVEVDSSLCLWENMQVSDAESSSHYSVIPFLLSLFAYSEMTTD